MRILNKQDLQQTAFNIHEIKTLKTTTFANNVPPKY